MAKSTREQSPHTPVSNQPEERATVGKTASRPPSEGKDPRTPKPTAQGTEQVEGAENAPQVTLAKHGAAGAKAKHFCAAHFDSPF